MAELLLPNIAGNFQQGQAFGTQQRQVREGEQRRNTLAGLAQQAYSAPQDQQQGILAQAVGVDPDAGMALDKGLQQSKGARVKQLAQRAKLFVGMMEAGNEQAAISAYPQLAQEARQLGLGDVDLVYNPQMLGALKQFATLGDPDSSDALKSLRVGEDGFYYAIQGGQLVNTGVKAAPNNQVFDTNAGIYGIDKRTLRAAPVQLGGDPQASVPQSGVYQTPQGIVRIADDLTPEQRQAAMADMSVGGEAQSVTLPPRDVSPSQGGGQLYSAPKPISPIEQSRLGIEQERLRLAQEANARAAQAATLKTNRPMPPNVLRMREETQAEAETAEGINMSLDKHLGRLNAGKLTFGPVRNRLYEAQNLAGQSNEESRNYAEFKSDLEKLRNDSLRLNAGVQTDGDAQRAWNELLANINDPELVKQRLTSIRALNERARTLKLASVERMDEEYGGVGTPSQAAAVDDDESLFGKYID